MAAVAVRAAGIAVWEGIAWPALRDAIVAQAIAPDARGRAFGFHRAMDTVGAVAGPLLGVGLLGWAERLTWSDATGPFRFVFWLTLVFGYATGIATAGVTALAFAGSAGGLVVLAAIFFLAGLYVAVQEALEASPTADLVPGTALGTAYGALGTVNGTAKFMSSAAVGLVWTLVSPVLSFVVAALLMSAGTLLLATTRMDAHHSH